MCSSDLDFLGIPAGAGEWRQRLLWMLDTFFPRDRDILRRTVAPEANTGLLRDGQPETPSTRKRFREMLRKGDLNERSIELEMTAGSPPTVEVFTVPGMESMQNSMQEAFAKMFPGKKERRQVKVPEALDYLKREEAENLVDQADVAGRQIGRASCRERV